MPAATTFTRVCEYTNEASTVNGDCARPDFRRGEAGLSGVRIHPARQI